MSTLLRGATGWMSGDRWPAWTQDQRLQDFLFAFNIAYAWVFCRAYTEIYEPFLRVEHYFYYRLALRPVELSAYLAFLSLVLFGSLALYMIARLSRWLAPPEYILLPTAGFCAVAAPPVCWYFVDGRYGWRPYIPEALLYLILWGISTASRRVMPKLMMVVGALPHYIFWLSRFLGYEHTILHLLTPAVAFAACASWASQVVAAKSNLRADGLTTAKAPLSGEMR